MREKFNGSPINYVSYKEVFRNRPSGRAEPALSRPVCQSDWQTAAACKRSKTHSNIIHSSHRREENAEMIPEAARAKWNGLLRGGTVEVEGEEVMDSPTSWWGKVWLMAVHSAKHTSCERR